DTCLRCIPRTSGVAPAYTRRDSRVRCGMVREVATGCNVTRIDGIDTDDNHKYCDYHDWRDDRGGRPARLDRHRRAAAAPEKGDPMTFSLLPLLMVEEGVPARARAEIRAAKKSPAFERRLHLEAAARALCDEAQLDRADALELVGLADL